VLAACSSAPREDSYRAPAVSKDVKSNAPAISYTISRTGLEFQIDRGSKVGDELLGGKLVIDRVVDDSSLGVLEGTIQVKSRAAEPLFGLYRIVFYDDANRPVGPVFSQWTPLSIDEPFGAATLHAMCSQRKAVYFVLEAWQGGAQAKADVPPAK
jgi:hypothetical protein